VPPTYSIEGMDMTGNIIDYTYICTLVKNILNEEKAGQKVGRVVRTASTMALAARQS
jgi:hypothetical protein